MVSANYPCKNWDFNNADYHHQHLHQIFRMIQHESQAASDALSGGAHQNLPNLEPICVNYKKKKINIMLGMVRSILKAA